MAEASQWSSVAADSKLNELLARYPAIGPILVQAGRGYVDRRGDLYAQFPDLTVAQYAEMNGLDVGTVVRRLQAAAESEEMTRGSKITGKDREDSPSVRRLPLAIGYTSSYDEREGLGTGAVPLTMVQPDRGPV